MSSSATNSREGIETDPDRPGVDSSTYNPRTRHGEEVETGGAKSVKTTWVSRARSLGTRQSRPTMASEDVQHGGALSNAMRVCSKFARFMGPGAIISVAYVDPDNYQTNIQAGQDFQYKLLFMILVANLIAIYQQYLSLKLGTVTGKDLAQMNHSHLPRWLELIVYVVAEACIMCTDISQVVGTAFAWSLLIPQLPLVWAVVLTVVETLLILFFYSPTGTLRRIRLFEMFVGCLVLAVFVTLCLLLAEVAGDTPAGPVWRGFVPSREIFVGQGLYTSCAIIGGSLQPHALYVGSAVARPRLLEHDIKSNVTSFEEVEESDASSTDSPSYRPSLGAIRSCLRYSAWELVLTVLVVAVFVNSALVIIAGTAFSDDDEFSTLYDLYNLFVKEISKAAAVLFAVSLLFSGISAGIVATVGGQIVMEAAWKMRLHPFWRRLITRSVAIVPALIICTVDGVDGMANALVACNYVLAIGLVFVSLPLVWYVTHDRYMRVPVDDGTGTVSMRTGVFGIFAAWIVWTFVIVLDIATVVLLGLGITTDD